MKRRQFISQAAIGGAVLRSCPAWATDGSPWQNDGIGSVARIGVLTPDFDPVPESEIWAMAPRGVSVHASRVSWKGDAKAFAESPHIDVATEQLLQLAPRAIISAFTSSSYASGRKADDAVQMRLQDRVHGIPVVLTCLAALNALRALRVRRVALIHPPWFPEEISHAGRDYFSHEGFDVVFCERLTPLRRFVEVSPAEVHEWTRQHVPRQAEALFIGGNGLRAVGAIQSMERDLDMPVLTANQVAFWAALRIAGAGSQIVHYGRLFQLDRIAG